MTGKRSGKREEVIVGDVPLTLSRIFQLFLKNGGRISVTVVGKRRNKLSNWLSNPRDVYQYKKPSKLNKLSELATVDSNPR